MKSLKTLAFAAASTVAMIGAAAAEVRAEAQGDRALAAEATARAAALQTP